MDFDSKIMPKKYQRKQENKAGALSFSHFLSYAANIPVDTGRKLNVLCTFNLRSVFTGMFHTNYNSEGFLNVFDLNKKHFNRNCFIAFPVVLWCVDRTCT